MLLGVAAAVSEWEWWWRVNELSDLQIDTASRGVLM